jgi:hypothetical protein
MDEINWIAEGWAEDDLYWLAEATITAEQRRKWAKAGQALPDGSWPIPDRAFLKKAIQSFGRGDKSNARVKAWIVKRARALKLVDLLPDKWNVAEAELSLDQQGEKVRDSWRELVKSELGSSYDSWCSEVYVDKVVVKQGDDYWQVPYSRNDDDEIVFDRDAATKVERQWIEVTEAFGFLTEPITEAEDDEATGAEWDVTIAKVGVSKNGRIYSAKVLKEAVENGLFEGVRVLARSDDEHLKGKGKDVRNIVGWIDGVTFSNNQVKGRLHLSEAAEGLRKLLVDAWRKGKRDLVGLSLVGNAKGFKPITRNGRRLSEVTGIATVQTVDLVVDPSAGGQLNRLAAAEGKEESVGLKELIEALLGRGNGKAAQAALAEASDEEREELKKEDPDIESKIAEAIGDPDPEDKPKPKAKAKPKAGTKPTEPIVEADGDDDDEDLVPASIARFVVREALNETKLPDPVRKRIEKRFVGTSFAEADLTEAISDELDTWKELEKENLVSRSAGSTRDAGTVGIEEADRAKAALDGFFLGEAVEIDGEKIAPYRSFKRAYMEITGDGLADGVITGRLPKNPIGKFGMSEADGGRFNLRLSEADADGELVLAEAVSSTTFDQALGDSVTRKMVRDYRLSNLGIWEPLADTVPLSDFRTNRRVRVGGYANLPTVAEGAAYLALTSPGDEEATYVPAKRGGTETINLETIMNDDVGVIRRLPTKLSRAAAQTLHEFVLDFLRSNPTIYDAVALFVAGHNNLGSTALSLATLAAARLRMVKQAEAGSSKRLGLTPSYLWVPPELDQIAYELTASDRKPGTADNDANYVRDLNLTYVEVPYWTDTNNWFVTASKDQTPLIELGFVGSEEPELFTQDMPNVGSMFTNDQLTYKIRHIYGGAVVDFRGFDGSIVA